MRTGLIVGGVRKFKDTTVRGFRSLSKAFDKERYAKVEVMRSCAFNEAGRMVNSWRESPRRFYGSAAPVKVVRSGDGRWRAGFRLAAPP
jgi:hypothetical protein